MGAVLVDSQRDALMSLLVAEAHAGAVLINPREMRGRPFSSMRATRGASLVATKATPRFPFASTM